MTSAPTTEPVGWRRLIHAAGVLGGLLLVASLVALATNVRSGATPTLPQWALAVALAGASTLILRNLLLFDWRGQRVALAPDEMLVFIALVALPAPLVMLFAVPAMTAFQYQTRRGWLRGSANVSVLLLATGAAVAAYAAARAAGLPPPLAAIAAIPVYTLVTLLVVSAFFAMRERADAFVVFRERFVVPLAFHVLVGIAGGLAVVALWSYHPLATLVLAPLALLLRRHAKLMARSDRETAVRARIAQTTRALVGEGNVETVADRALATAIDVFRAGHVELALEGGSGSPPRRWTRDAPGGHDPTAPPLAEPIPSEAGSPGGVILVRRTRATHERYDATDRALLQVLAGELAASLANARALHALDESRKQILTSRVARPLVRRIVRSLVEETRADHHVLMRLGQGLAREADAHDLGTLCAAYAEMGLGALQVASVKGEQFIFHGNDLFERQNGAHATTCYIALGFLTGTMSRLNGKPAKGAEVACQSRGDEACRFVVQLREPEAETPKPFARASTLFPGVPPARKRAAE